MRNHSGFVWELRAGESLAFSTDDGKPVDVGLIRVELEYKTGPRARMRVHAPEGVLIRRVAVSQNSNTGRLTNDSKA